MTTSCLCFRCVVQIATELSRLSLLASTNKLSPEDVSGGTISISNIGVIGGKTGSPLLNLPEVAIVAFGRIDKLPRFASDGSIIAASVLTVSTNLFPLRREALLQSSTNRILTNNGCDSGR